MGGDIEKSRLALQELLQGNSRPVLGWQVAINALPVLLGLGLPEPGGPLGESGLVRGRTKAGRKDWPSIALVGRDRVPSIPVSPQVPRFKRPTGLGSPQ